MKQILLASLVISSTAAAALEFSPYVSLNGGAGYIRDVKVSVSDTTAASLSFDGGYVIEGAVGVKLNRGPDTWPLRGEVAYSYQKNDLNKLTDNAGIMGTPGAVYIVNGDATASALMANVYADVPLGYGFSPYIVGGLGAVWLDLNSDDLQFELNRDLAFAGQIGGGVGYHITDSLILDLRYVFIRTADFSIRSEVHDPKFQASVHRLTAGLRYEF